MLGLEDFEAWNLALADLQEDVIRVILCLERCVDCVPEPLSWRLFDAESDVGNVVRTAVDLFRSGCTTKKWHGFQVPSQLHIP